MQGDQFSSILEAFYTLQYQHTTHREMCKSAGKISTKELKSLASLETLKNGYIKSLVLDSTVTSNDY